jgi:hypothetical protein
MKTDLLHRQSFAALVHADVRLPVLLSEAANHGPLLLSRQIDSPAGESARTGGLAVSEQAQSRSIVDALRL